MVQRESTSSLLLSDLLLLNFYVFCSVQKIIVIALSLFNQTKMPFEEGTSALFLNYLQQQKILK